MSCPVIHVVKADGFNIAKALIEKGLLVSKTICQYNRQHVPTKRLCHNVLDMSNVEDEIIFQNIPDKYQVKTLYSGIEEKERLIRSYADKGFSVKESDEKPAEENDKACDWITFEKEWDKDVYDSLRYAFVIPAEDGSIRWVRNYYSDDLPLVAISKTFPNQKFVYIERSECTEDGASIYAHELIKDGKCIKNLFKD